MDEPAFSVNDMQRDQGKWRLTLEAQTNLALRSLASSDRFNLYLGVYFYFMAVVCFGVAIFFLTKSWIVDDSVFIDLERIASTSLTAILIQATWPIIVAVVLGVIAVSTGLLLQSRNRSNFEKALEGVSRLRRESAIGVSRSRAMTQILEETLINSRRAFNLQLAISRTLFLVGLLLLLIYFVDTIFRDSSAQLTLPLAGGSILSFIIAAIANPQRTIGGNLSDVTQLQAILASFTRQSSILEEYIYQVIEAYRFMEVTRANDHVMQGLDKLSEIMDSSMQEIEDMVENEKKPGVLERWLVQRNWIG